jgi:hypothetical protein
MTAAERLKIAGLEAARAERSLAVSVMEQHGGRSAARLGAASALRFVGLQGGTAPLAGRGRGDSASPRARHLRHLLGQASVREGRGRSRSIASH